MKEYRNLFFYGCRERGVLNPFAIRGCFDAYRSTSFETTYPMIVAFTRQLSEEEKQQYCMEELAVKPLK